MLNITNPHALPLTHQEASSGLSTAPGLGLMVVHLSYVKSKVQDMIHISLTNFLDMHRLVLRDFANFPKREPGNVCFHSQSETIIDYL